MFLYHEVKGPFMIQLEFTQAQIDTLETERYTHPDPKVQRKLETLYLKSLDLPHHQIRRICRLSEPALVRYLRTYAQEGLAGLKRNRYGGQPSVLGPQAQSLEAYLRQHPPANSAQARQVIQAQTGVQRSLTQVRAFLHRLGMKYRKTGFVPGKSDTPEKQAEQDDYVKKTPTGAGRSAGGEAGGSFPGCRSLYLYRLSGIFVVFRTDFSAVSFGSPTL